VSKFYIGDYARINIPDNVDCHQAVRRKWNGKIAVWHGTWVSLEGRQDEGISLSCPDEYATRLNDEETKIAELLEATFWQRTSYTESLDILTSLLQPGDRT
jgi:hypothetical protein